MSTSTLHARATPLAPVPMPATVVRIEPTEPRPFVVGSYVGGHRWSPLLGFKTSLEAMIYAAAVNRRNGRWTK